MVRGLKSDSLAPTMPISIRRLAGLLAVACLAVAVAHPRAQAPGTPAPPGSAGGTRATAPPVRVDRFTDRVWSAVAPSDIAPGTLYVFLSTNALVISSPDSKTTVGTWAESADGLVITEAKRSYKVDVVELNAGRFRIRVHKPGTPTDITFAPAVQAAVTTTLPVDGAAAPASGVPPPASGGTAAPPKDSGPLPTSYRCAGEVYGVAFESGKAYLTLPDQTLIVMDELQVRDAPSTRRTFTNGTLTIVEDTSEAHTRVLFARGRLMPRPCTSMR